MTDYNCCRGDTSIGHDNRCPRMRRTKALETISKSLEKMNRHLVVIKEEMKE